MYYDDGLNRIREESGLGSIHSIKSDGSGKTVKYYYSTPSETEIVRLFGSEAPSHESISKVVKVDQNNTATISYNTVDGKVLATCLSFYDGDNMNLEAVDNAPGSDDELVFSDKITKNFLTSEGFISSKRLVFLEPTDLTIGYQVKVNQLKAQCQTLTLDCQFRLFVYLHKLETGERIPIYDNINLSGATTTTIGDEEFIILSPVTLPAAEISTGTYVVEKKIIPGDAGVSIAETEKEIQNQIAPIAKLVSEWLKSIHCEEIVQPYYNSMIRLSESINDKTFDTFDNTDPNDPTNTDHEIFPVYAEIFEKFWEIYLGQTPDGQDMKDLYEMYLLSEDENYDLYLTPPGQNPEYIVINSGCCEILLNVKWTPSFDFNAEPELKDPDLSGEPTVYNYYDIYNGIAEAEFIPDFEGFALAYMQDCDELNGEYDDENSFYHYMEGWDYPGTFNMMIHNMITDLYECENPYIEAEKEAVGEENYVNPFEADVDACGNPIVEEECDDGNCPQYTTKELFECWQGVLFNLRQNYCGEDLSNYNQEESNISDGIDEENEGDGDVHDDHFDDNSSGGGFITRWLAKRSMAKKMRDLNYDGDVTGRTAYEGHLVEEFLKIVNCPFL